MRGGVTSGLCWFLCADAVGGFFGFAFWRQGLTAATNVVGEAVRTLHRVIVESVTPEVHAGRFAIKRIVGDELRVRADIYADGHDSLGARLLWRREDERTWNEVPMRLDNNDRWESRFKLEKLGRYFYTGG